MGIQVELERRSDRDRAGGDLAFGDALAEGDEAPLDVGQG